MEEEKGNVPGKSMPAPIALPISFLKLLKQATKNGGHGIRSRDGYEE